MPKPLLHVTSKPVEGAVLYLRVSTEEQVENYSLETQEDICKKEAQKRGLAVVETFREEGRSAKTIKGRPTLLEMLDYCRKHRKEVRAVIVYRLDRISRQTSDYLSIRKKLSEYNMVLISASEPTGNSPTEKFVETMLAGFAQMDNDVRSERTKNGLRARFLSGLYNGPVPFGYLNQDGYATKDPEAFEVVKEAWKLMLTGTKSLQDMADYFNEKGFKCGHGGKKEFDFRPQAVNRIFRNKFYAGKVVSPKRGEEVLGQHTSMITEAEFYKVQEILDGRNRSLNAEVPVLHRNQDNEEFPLRRILKCDICGSSLTGAKSKGKKKRYSYYFCQKRCKRSYAVSFVEEKTEELLKSITPTEETIDLFNAYLRRTYFQRIATLKKRQEQGQTELKKLYELRQGLVEKHLMGVYSDDMFKEQNLIIEQKIKAIHIAQNDELLTKYNLEDITRFIKAKLSDLVQTFTEENTELEEKRALLCSIFPHGMVWNGNGYSNTPISESYKLIREYKVGQNSFGSANESRTRLLRLKI